MTPAQFIAKWQHSTLSEKAGAQPHFLDLCEMLGVEKPGDPDNYCFERGATRTGAGHGWADVWKRNYFGWENKGPGADLGKALKQLMTYALALDNPPLLIVCDRQLIQIHTHFTGAPSEVHTIRIEDIGEPENLQKLRWVFTDPEKFRPGRTVQDVTAEAAGRFAQIAQALTSRGHDPQKVAHFLIQCLFAMFAEDSDLLPEKLFERILAKSANAPDKVSARLGELFKSMQAGGEFLLEDINYFNGGLFATVEPLPLEASEIAELHAAAKMDWSHIEPSIFGTLFERGLDPAMRSQLGANYTDPATISKLIDPVVTRPLAKEWEVAKPVIAAAMEKYHAGGKGSQSAYKTAQAAFFGYIERLKNFRVLDPACGSGNFLYLALRALKDLEHRANLDAEALGLHRQLTIEVSPANVLGIELNSYAAELARVTVWIGEIQWMIRHGYDIRRNPILSTLDHVECRDAILGPDGKDSAWPACDVIVGNPPFLGNKKMLAELGQTTTESIRSLFKGRLPGGVDLVIYWFERARSHIQSGNCLRAGLVSTQAIRKGSNRKVLERIVESTPIFEAWRDEPWVNEGASVRVSLVAFGSGGTPRIDGEIVTGIQADLSAASGGFDLTQAKRLPENAGISFQGPVKVGAFDIPGDTARAWLKMPNPNGRPTSDVLRPWANGQDLTGRPSDTWIIDFGVDMSESDAAFYDGPFAHVREHVKPMREAGRRESRKRYWWRHGETVPALRKEMSKISRYIATVRVAKHRFFVWLPVAVLPDSRLYAICRDDDFTFGVLSSRIHEVWALANASRHGDGDEGGRPTYNAADCFETFPFPPISELGDAISKAAKNLDDMRTRWLFPAEWVDCIPEIVAGYPERRVPKQGHEADLKARTMTNLYNAPPAWLVQLHQALDQVVADAYGWEDYSPAMPDAEILRRLMVLNAERSAA